ncbi:MAG: hypothetical protein KGD63_00050 [Candidatus Lokiarchaeota archaeon]|nr:hypothetical protein [Candidatus Lokiarchaeota archaeon]
MKHPSIELVTIQNSQDTSILTQHLKKAWDLKYDIIFEVVNSGSNYYAQFAVYKEKSLLWWEFISNEFLNPPYILSDEKIQKLFNRGFINQDPELYRYPSPNFFKECFFKEIMEESVDIFLERYGIKYPIELKIKFVN